MKIHPQAIVSPQAKLGRDVVIGPFAIIESDVEIGDGCELASGVVVKDGTKLGQGNRILEGTVIGGYPQHTRMPEQLGRIVIGDNNTLREHCTVHRALHAGTATTIGDNNLLMVCTTWPTIAWSATTSSLPTIPCWRATWWWKIGRSCPVPLGCINSVASGDWP